MNADQLAAEAAKQILEIPVLNEYMVHEMSAIIKSAIEKATKELEYQLRSLKQLYDDYWRERIRDGSAGLVDAATRAARTSEQCCARDHDRDGNCDRHPAIDAAMSQNKGERMTPKERIDKRAKEMHKAILKEVKRLEGELGLCQMWILLARQHGPREADKRMQENLNWKP